MILITILTIFFVLTHASRSFSDVLISQNPMITYNSLNAGDLLGYRVSKAGDFNADGFQDFLISSHNTRNGDGAVYLIFGSKNGLSDITLSSSGLSPSQGMMVYGANGEHLGSSASYAGDVNGDKIDDIIIGANQFQTARGAAYIIYGSKNPPAILDLAQGLDPNQGFAVIGSTLNSFLGGSVSWAGDVNNDKIDDVIIGAYASSVIKGAAYVIFGKTGTRNKIELSSGLSSSEGFAVLGAVINDALGVNVAGGGDIDGDGIGDIVIVANGAYGGSGAVYIIYGKKKNSTFGTIDLGQGLSSSEGFMVKGGSSNAMFGGAVVYAGDLNDDGFDDVMIGAPYENVYEGAVYVIFGRGRSLLGGIDLSSVLDPARGLKFKGGSSQSALGFSLNRAGDINGDGIDDIIMGAPMENNQAGSAYVVFGSKNLDSEIALINGLSPTEGFKFIGKTSFDVLGTAVSAAGDVNGDGMIDLLVGAYGVNSQAGDVYLWLAPLVCSENCLTCEKASVCLACKAGYGLENSKCIVCPSTSELVNGVCVPKKSSLETATEVSKGLFDSSSTASRVFTMGRSLSVGLGLMAKIIQNVRYLNISYPKEVLDAFESYGTDLFELPIPEAFYESPDTKGLPSQYERYDIAPSFLENYWQTMMPIFITLVCFLVIKGIQYLTKSQKKSSAVQVALKNIGQTAANFLVIQIYSNLDDVIFFFLLDASSTKMSSVSAGLSLGVGSVFLLLGFALIVLHCWILGKYQKAKEQDKLERFKKKFRFLGTLYEDFKDENAVKQSFFGILILRCVFLVLVIMLLQPPWIQASLLMLANLIFMGYMIYQRPFKSRFDEFSQYFCEATIFVAYLGVLVLSILDYKEDFSSQVRVGFGKCIVLAGIVLSLGGFIIQVIQIVGAIWGIYQFFKENSKRKRQRVPLSITLRNRAENESRVVKSKSILRSQISESSHVELSGIFNKNSLDKSRNLNSDELEISMFNTENALILQKKLNSEINSLKNEKIALEPKMVKISPNNPMRNLEESGGDLNVGGVEFDIKIEAVEDTSRRRKKINKKLRIREKSNRNEE